MVAFWILVIGVLGLIGLWLIGAYLYHDFSIPSQTITASHLLVIYPHPDDEALTTAGIMALMTTLGKKVTFILLTKGERGVEGGTLTPKLAAVRASEARNVADILDLSECKHLSYPDGDVAQHTAAIEKDLAPYFTDTDVDLVITYDKSGLYGHPDHIATTKIVEKLVHKHKKELWFATLPKKLFDRFSLPTHMAQDPEWLKHRTYPTHKILLSPAALWKKIQVLNAHKSQHFAFRKNRKYLPLSFYTSLGFFEYFYRDNKS